MEGQVWHLDPREVTSSVLCGCTSWRAGATSLAGQAMKVCRDCPPEQRNAVYKHILSVRGIQGQAGRGPRNLIYWVTTPWQGVVTGWALRSPPAQDIL